jgi:DNA polymerase III alpha subunit
MVELAKRHELPSIALTDKNNLHGAVEFAQWAAAAGINLSLALNSSGKAIALCLYAQNQQGYHNLCRILSEVPGPRRFGATTDEDYHFLGTPASRRRVQSFERSKLAGETSALPANLKFSIFNFQFSIPSNTEGLLALSPHAELAQFFPDRFYLEVNSLDAFDKRPRCLPGVASFPVHYDLPADRWKYDIVQSIRTLTLLRQQHPDKRLDGQYHFRAGAEMRKLFAAHPELLAHSLEIAERCSFTITPGKPQFPAYPPPNGLTPAAFLHQLVMEGLQRRYRETMDALERNSKRSWPSFWRWVTKNIF